MIDVREIRVAHFCCGIGVGAMGFNDGEARVGNMQARFRCLGGIDVDPLAIRNFSRLVGVPGTVLDLFTLEQYIAFHGKQPPPGWREVTIPDIHRAFGYERPHIIFMSAPCKGFSGLLSESRSLSAKYQALNQLALRCVWLAMEAWSDDPPELLLFENVPRIATRGRPLLDQIESLVSNYRYASAETTHDCGEIGGLAQTRKRFLLVCRHEEKVPASLHQPVKHRLRAVGEVLGKMKLPGDPAAGPMHRVPQLHWKTWVRLAFIRAGKDWRDLQRLRVADGVLQDFALVPDRNYYTGAFGVQRWDRSSGTVAGESGPSNGAFSVADPYFDPKRYASGQLGVNAWEDTASTLTGQRSPQQGKFSVADPRITQSGEYQQLGVRRWNQSSGAIGAQSTVGGGPFAVADPRIDGVKHNNCFRVVRWESESPSVTGGTGPSAGGLAVGDPRYPWKNAHENKMRVSDWEDAARAVTGSDRVGSGALSVADPRPENGWAGGKYRVTGEGESAGTVIAESGTGNGAFAVADPRPDLVRTKGDHYLTAGHYGVVPWDRHAYAVTGSGQHDNGHHNVADPRLPAPTDRLVAIIRAEDGTWHRPFTTLELAALQSMFDPEEDFYLDGTSDSQHRAFIGNAVPRAAAKAIAGVMGQTLLLAWSGETFVLSSTPVWVRPIAIALSVMQRKPI